MASPFIESRTITPMRKYLAILYYATMLYLKHARLGQTLFKMKQEDIQEQESLTQPVNSISATSHPFWK